jgi:hypothetical protein
MSTLATIVDGELDAADLLFLVAFILFAVATVLDFAGRAVPGLIPGGLACMVLGLLVL